MSRYFASADEIAKATTSINIDAAIEHLSDGGLPEGTLRYCPAGGPVVYCSQDGTQQVVSDDSHSITFASTGRGKTRRFIYPTVVSDILSGTNLVINDMKGEIYATTRGLLAAAGYTVYVLDLRKPRSSPHRFNPLDVAWRDWHSGDDDSAFLRLRNFAQAIYSTRGFYSDPFWENSAIDYFVGISLGMLEVGVSRNAFTMESVANVDLAGNRGSIYGKHLDVMFNSLPPTSIALQNASGTLYAPDKTRQSILATFRQPMSLYAGQKGLMDVLCRSDFSIEDLTRERRALFIISPDETHSLGPIVVGIMNQVMSGLITYAQDRHNGILPNRVDFILDEMGNLPARIPDLEALVSAARSRNIRFHFVLQSSEQLTNVYGEQLKNVILDNCNTWVFMGSRGLPFLRHISDLAGTVRLETGEERPLLSVDKLQHLETRKTETEALVFLSSLRPYVSALKDIGTYASVDKTAEEQSPCAPVVHEIFDIERVAEEALANRRSLFTADDVEPAPKETCEDDNEGVSAPSEKRQPVDADIFRRIDELLDGSSDTQ